MANMERVKLDKEEVYNTILNTKTVTELVKTLGHSKEKILDFIKHNELYKIYCEHYKIQYKENYLRPCCICGSTNQVESIGGKIYCKKHTNHMRRYGKIIEKTIYDLNDYRIDNKTNTAYIIIRDKYQNFNGELIIDLEDLDKLKQYKWFKSYGYAVTKGITPTKNMDVPNVIFDDYDGMYDHIDNNKLNNKKSNLRPVSSQQNSMNMSKKCTNSSGVTGVQSKKVKGGIKWYSVLTYNYKPVWLGCYNTFDEAVLARLKGEAKYFKNYSPNYKTDSNTIKLTYVSKTDNEIRTIEINLNGEVL